jgi:FMN phosphatase YigB (HAD superfamily)
VTDLMTEVFCVALDYGHTIDLRTLGTDDEYACFPVDPEAVTAMHELRRLHRTLIVASNTLPERPRDKPLEAAGVRDLLIGVLQSHELGFAKPDRRFFAAIEEVSGYAAAQICYVGNRIDTDIVPALEVGMRAVLVAPTGLAPASFPTGVPLIRHVRELPNLFADRHRQA